MYRVNVQSRSRQSSIAERARGGWRREKPDVRTPPVFPDSADRADADGDEEEYDYDEGSPARSYRATQWHDGPGNGCGGPSAGAPVPNIIRHSCGPA